MSVRETLAMITRPERHTILDRQAGFMTSLERQFSSPDSLSDPFRFEALVRDGYRLNTIVRACVDEIATSISEPTLIVQVRRGNKWETFEPGGRGRPNAGAAALHRLLQDPVNNGRTTQYSFMEEMLTHYNIFGNVLIRKRRREGNSTIGALELLPVPRLNVDLDDKGVLKGVVVRRFANRSLVAPIQDAVKVPLEDFIHIKKPDPIEQFWGLPPMVSALRAIDTDDKAQDYLRAFFMNQGAPAGILSLKGRVLDEERRSIRDRWMANYSGQSGWHRLAVLDQDAEYNEIGTRPDKLKLDSIFDKTESSICSAFQVPPVIIAVRIGLNKSTYSNYSQARVSFWRETLRPLYVRVDQALTMGLASEFGDDLRIAHDFSDVDDLQEPEEQRRKWARQGLTDGVLTLNESREIVGLPSVGDGGDFFKTRTSDGVPQKVGDLPLANPPKPEPKPAPVASSNKDQVRGALETSETVPPDSQLQLVGKL